MNRLVLRVCLRVCWLLEDMVDFLVGVERGSRFYPSARFENMLREMKYLRGGGVESFQGEG